MDPVLELVERSNQRGGRMLSVIDLIRAETLTRRETCWLLARIEQGSSWLVGARPGGAGKTTVMSALLAMLPEGEKVRLTVPGSGWEKSAPGDCIVAYELNHGGYEGYIWGNDVKQLARLAASGCRVVANLHADTLAEAIMQIVSQNDAAPKDFPGFGMFIPIQVGGMLSARRRVGSISYFTDGEWRTFDPSTPPPTREETIGGFLDQCLRQDIFAVAEVRAAWGEWRKQNVDVKINYLKGSKLFKGVNVT